MKYLCLVYHEEEKIDALPASEYDAIVREVLAYREELRQGGHYITSSPLESVQTATTIRVRGGKVSVTDGPFAETREQLGGFYLIEARDLNEGDSLGLADATGAPGVHRGAPPQAIRLPILRRADQAIALFRGLLPAHSPLQSEYTIPVATGRGVALKRQTCDLRRK